MASLTCRAGDAQALKVCIAAAAAELKIAVQTPTPQQRSSLGHAALSFTWADVQLTDPNSIVSYVMKGGTVNGALIDDWMEWETSTLRSAVYLPGATAASLAPVLKRMEASLNQSRSNFLVGDTLTAADVAVFCTLLPCSKAGLLSGSAQAFMSSMLTQESVNAGIATMFPPSTASSVDKQLVDTWREDSIPASSAAASSARSVPGAGASSRTANRGANPDGESDAVSALAQRWSAILTRIQRAEDALGQGDRAAALWQRQAKVLQRISALESALGISQAATGPSATATEPTAAEAPPVPGDESGNYRAQHAELVRRGVTDFRLVRVPGPYYDRPYEFRAACLNAQSVDHLCKTMVMENTRAPPHVVDCSNPKLSKYYMVLVQYTAVINADKLKKFVYKMANEVEKLGKSQINMRMADEQLSCEMTGFGHNAVTPICSKTPIPIIMSDRIAKLPGHFFLGAGEVDLKVGMKPADFISAFGDVPLFVTDCTM